LCRFTWWGVAWAAFALERRQELFDSRFFAFFLAPRKENGSSGGHTKLRQDELGHEKPNGQKAKNFKKLRHLA
jgi:hypothetical protein